VGRREIEQKIAERKRRDGRVTIVSKGAASDQKETDN
jgi:hypothetical protein